MALQWGLVFAIFSTEGNAETEGGDFPRKPIKVIVPFSSGGGSDTFTRIMQKGIRDAELLPQPLVVINVPGAGGTVGSRRVRNASPDGYTILNLHEGIFSSKYAGRVPYGPEAFRAIAATGESAPVICVKEGSPHSDLGSLMKAAAQRDAVLFGMAPGTPSHFAGRRLELAASPAAFRFVASGGGSKRFNDLIGGHIDVSPFSLAEYTKFAPGGIRAIAYLGKERHPGLPECPTAREQGMDVVMSHIQYWWAPKATPDAAIDRIASALEAAMATDYVSSRLAELKTEGLFLKGNELDAHLKQRERDFQDAALVNYEGFPNLVPGIVLAIACLFVGCVVQHRFGLGATSKASASPTGWRYFAITFAVIAVYVLGMQFAAIPYTLATACFIPFMGLAGGLRSVRGVVLLVVVGAVLAWMCYHLFTKVFVIDLP